MLSHFSHVQVFAMLWTVERQTLLSMGFPGQEYWSGLPCPPTRDFPNPGIEPVSLRSPALAGMFFTASTPGKPYTCIYKYIYSFCIVFHYGLLQDIEYNSLCCSEGPCCLFILCVTVCIC